MTDALDIDTSPDNAAAEDRALLHRLRNGEDAAFGELFSRHSDAVRRLALGLAADRAEAEDLTAEAFFRVLQAIRRGSGPVDNVRGYLLIVARRVAWEWNGRRRDVPVSDEELNHRVGADPDRSGQSTERNLITRAFTSLPERWRSVLWEVEVEGARPAVVAGNFGLSPNATAALARRARQGLRAAYLQAHLSIDRGSTGCRSVLEKLGAYTAGTIKGVERRKVRAHITTCASCSAMVDELQDVCSGLRAHAAFLAAPVAGVALWQHMGAASAAATGIKGLLANVKIQAALAATSAAAVGAFGYAMVAVGGPSSTAAFDDLDGTRAPEVVITDLTRITPTPTGAPAQNPPAPAHGKPAKQKPGDKRAPATRETVIENIVAVPDQPVAEQAAAEQAAQGGSPGLMAAPRLLPAEYDESQPVVFEKTSYERKWAIYDQYDVVDETTTTTRVNAADQTTVVTETTHYTVWHTAPPADYKVMLSPTGEPTETGPVETKPTDPPSESTKPEPTEPVEPEPTKPEPTESAKPAATPTTVVAS
ncbi:sigma-70 family RNA polymerase sigma factor [Actinokineospora sp. HUAS TT18]|uniref:sigma-70 family RNA polymerase sigma factor n=1 Tax=Actinokineospora sp. HUAS TT18 TaxID=3447451 RepID=UPI003F52866B